MLIFIVRRLAMGIPTLIGVTLLSFFLIRMIPGDPVLLMLGERGSSEQAYQEMKASMGLDRPLPEQYIKFVWGAIRGDLGTSISSKRPVSEEFLDRFPATIELSTVALAIAVIFGIPLGIWAALRRNKLADYLVMTSSLVGFSMPVFWWGLLLIMFFSVQLGLTPVSGRIAAEFDVPQWSGLMLIDVWKSDEAWLAFKSALAHLVLPSIVLGTIPLAVIARMTRSSLLEVLHEDYIRTAKAKGVASWRVYFVHALRNALIPIVTVIGLTLGSLLTGAVLTETLFSWPGIGKWIVQSVLSRDYPVIQGGVLLIALLVVLTNLLVDVAYFWVNPQMRAKL